MTKSQRNAVIKKNMKILERTFSSLKTTGYREDEFEIARKIFVKEYIKKEGKNMDPKVLQRIKKRIAKEEQAEIASSLRSSQ